MLASDISRRRTLPNIIQQSPAADLPPFRLSALRCTSCGKRRRLVAVQPGQEPCAEVRDRSGRLIFPAVPARDDAAWCQRCQPQSFAAPQQMAAE